MTKQCLQEVLTHSCEEHDQTLVFLEPASDFGLSILGILNSTSNGYQVAYSRRSVLGAMMAPVTLRDGSIEPGMDADEAVEFYEFNTAGAYVSGGPVFISDGIDDPEISPEPHELRDWLLSHGDDGTPLILLEEKYDSALLGACEGICSEPGAVYDQEQLLKLFVIEGLSPDSATEKMKKLKEDYPVKPGNPKWLQLNFD